jgi:D-sedoheptulose 7-phosphate isomerase
MHEFIHQEIEKSFQLLTQIKKDEFLCSVVDKIAFVCVTALRQRRKILFAGNGGSAADSQHLAAEFVSKLSYNRPALSAIALTTDTSVLTAIGNDYGFENIFARQIEAIGQEGDVFIGISTSGRSPNILRALEIARQRQIITIGFTGKTAPLMNHHCDLLLNIPSQETQKIQECHIMFGHIVCALIENAFFGEKYHPAAKLEVALA